MISKNKIIYLTLSSILSFMLMSASFAETRYKVRSTDNLNKIIERYYSQSDLTRSQLLIGLLAKNQEAFRGGNINFLLRGKQLILPNESDIETLSDEEAKELLSEHARYFRRGQTGDFGSPIANGYLVNKNKKANIAIENKQELQTIKIDQLEKESDDLRKRLDKLIADKNESDEQLRKVEQALQNTLNNTKAVDQVSAESQALKFEESKKKLDEQQQKKIDTFQNINAEKTEIVNSTEQLEIQVENNDESSGVNIENATPKESGMTSIVSMLKKYYWAIIAFLLILFGWMWWAKNKRNRLIADEVNIQPEVEKAYQEDKNFLENITEEEPSSDTVKIDMAVAYIDAGDIDSATDILHRLINEGSSPQRERAQKLLNTL